MAAIDIIVPVYKVEKYLSRCVDSILAQTFTDYQLVLIDDGSPDFCPDICDEYGHKDSRIHVIHQPNGGLSAARNSGIDWAMAKSSGRWITFIDSDDWVHPRYLELLLNAVEETNSHISICGMYTSFGDSAEIGGNDIKPILWNTEAFFVENTVNATVAWGKLYEKECFRNVRYPVGKLHEDEYITFKILFKYPSVSVIEAPLYNYFQNENSIMNESFNNKHLTAYPALEEQIEFFSENGYDEAKRSVIRRYLINVVQKCKNKDLNREAARFFRERKRKYIAKYAKQLKISDEKDGWVLTQIYPHRMKIYWYYRALRKRIMNLIDNQR